MKTLQWAISKINSGAAMSHSLRVSTLMSCIFPLPLAHTLPWITDILGTLYTRTELLFPQSGLSGHKSALLWKADGPISTVLPLAVSLASSFVLCPIEYAKGFLTQQKNKLWWGLMCLCKHVVKAAAFKSQLLRRLHHPFLVTKLVLHWKQTVGKKESS